jgi:hypothetical protein
MYVISTSVVKKDSIRLLYSNDSGSTFSSLKMTLSEIVDSVTNSGKYVAVIPKSSATPRFYTRAVDATNISRTSPYKAPTELYDVKTGTTSVKPENPVPTIFTLEQNFPNPFNPKTVINYRLPRTSIVSLKVYDLLGKEITTLVSGVQPFGSYSVAFSGIGLASGIYFYRLQSDNFVETKKMVLLK